MTGIDPLQTLAVLAIISLLGGFTGEGSGMKLNSAAWVVFWSFLAVATAIPTAARASLATSKETLIGGGLAVLFGAVACLAYSRHRRTA